MLAVSETRGYKSARGHEAKQNAGATGQCNSNEEDFHGEYLDS